MKEGVFDAETTIRNRGEGAVGSLEASPFHPDNFMVAFGELVDGEKRLEYRLEGEELSPPWFLTTSDPVLMIGMNLSFDLKWMHREWPELFFAKLATLKIWDIQQADYLLSGQEHKFPSLNEISERHGLPAKIDTVSENYWKQGIDTVFVPKEELLEYLGAADLENPLEIYRDQWAELQAQPNLYLLALEKMDDILLTTLMEIFGSEFDLEFANEQAEKLEARMETLRVELVRIGQPLFVPHFEFDPDSGDHVSLAVFGGQYKVVEDVPVRDPDGNLYHYKTGKRKGEVKTRKEKVVYTTKGLGLKPGIAPKMKNGLYSSEHDYLQVHAEKNSFVKDVLEFRELSKDISTYFRGYAKFVFPDGKIHPSLNHAHVETGRLSSSQPNLQNVTVGDD